MALPTLIPPVRQSKGTKITPKLKIKKADFGDGYTMRAPDGINHIKDVVNLQWDTLLPADAIALENFFKAQGGTLPFYYDVDEGVIRKWICETWERGKNEVHSFSATLETSFSLET